MCFDAIGGFEFVDIAGYDFVFGFVRNKDGFENLFYLSSEFINRNGWFEFEFAFISLVELLFFNTSNAVCFSVTLHASIQIIEVLHMTGFGKGHRNGVHGMVSVVVTFGPIFNTRQPFAFLVDFVIGEA